MKNKLFFTLFLSLLASLGCIFAQLPQPQPAQPRYQDLPPELDHAALDRELQEMAAGDGQEFAPLDLTEKGFFHDFQETVLIEGPQLPYTNGVHVGLYGKDVLKVVFILLDAYIDSFLKKNLFKFVLTDFTKSLLEHKNKIAELIDNLTYDENNLLVFNDGYTALSSFISQHGFKTFSYFDDLNFKRIVQTLLHLLVSETSFGLQYQFFPRGPQGLVGQAIHKMTEIGQTMNQDEIFISLDYILEAPLLYLFGISQLASSNAPYIRRLLLTVTGFNHPFLDTYSFYLIKRLLIFTRFMKQNHELYHQKFCTYFMANIEKFKPLFTDSEEVNESKQRESIKNFLKEIDTTSFMEWFIYKNKCCNWTNFWLELIITSPALFNLGKTVYSLFYPSKGNA